VDWEIRELTALLWAVILDKGRCRVRVKALWALME
jgi:hypothetical protein